MHYMYLDLDLVGQIFDKPQVLISAVLGFLVLGAAGFALGRALGWRAVPSGLSLASLGVVVAVTFVRRPHSGTDTWAEVWGSCVQNDFSLSGSWQRLNFLLLMPFAFFAVLAIGRFLPVAVTTAGLAVAIEVLQALSGRGTCETQDMLNNGLGGMLAAALAWPMVSRRLRRTSGDH